MLHHDYTFQFLSNIPVNLLCAHIPGSSLSIFTGPTVVTNPKFSGLYSHSSSHAVQKYVSRPELENELWAQLIGRKGNGKERRTVVIWGLGGSGKSQLTLNYLQKHREAYEAIFWIDARVKETIERDFIQINKLLYPSLNTSSATVEDAIAAVKNWLSTQERRSQRRRALWIMDSADAIDGDREIASNIDIQHYLPDALNLDIIITTRSSRARSMSSFNSVEVKHMAEAEARLLFIKNANLLHQIGEIEQEVSKIVKELGCLALAVALAGSYVSETKIKVQQYLPRYREDRSRILALKPHKLEHQYNEGVLSTWELSLAALRRQSPMAAQLLTLLAFINPNDIFLGLFEDELKHTNNSSNLNKPRWLGLLSPSDANIDIFAIESAFADIHAYSLISWQVDRGAYVMHNLVHAWGYDRLDVSQRRYWGFATLELLNRVTYRNIYNPSISTRMAPHLVATFSAISIACESNHRIADRDRELLARLSTGFFALGHYTHVYDVSAFELKVTKLVYAPQHPKTLTAMYNLGIALACCGDHVQAEKLFREVLDLQKEILGLEHPDTLSTMGKLGESLFNSAKYELAEEVLQSTLELRQKGLGPDDHRTVDTMFILSLMLVDQGKYRQAEKMQRRVLESRKQTLGPENPHTLQTRYRLACTLRRLGSLEEAEQICRQTIESQQNLLGSGHPNTLSSRRLLALLLQKRGEYKQAKSIFQETIAIEEQARGPEHHNVLIGLYNFAWILQQHGEHEEAKQIWQRLVEPMTRTMGLEHPFTQGVLHSLDPYGKGKGKKTRASG